MLRLILWRVSLLAPVLVFVSIIAFALLRLAPGDPALVHAGFDATPERIEAIRTRLALDQPLPLQYWAWLRLAVAGDLGNSYSSGLPVLTILLSRVPVTLQIATMALGITIVGGVALGVLGAIHRGRAPDKIVRVASLSSISVPNYVLATLLVLMFGWLIQGVMPYEGFVRFSDSPLDSFRHSLLPAIALAMPLTGLVARLTRTSMVEALSQPYIEAARGFGVREVEVVLKDALRNAALPVVTIIGLLAGVLLGGSVAVETVFGVPGVGRLIIRALIERDYPVITGAVLFIALSFVVVNLLVDVLYGLINPKIRSGMDAGT